MCKQKFRQNVAALVKFQNEYLICRRKDYGTWQTIQGGIEPFDLSPSHALIREMHEELGVKESDFKIIYQSSVWRRYLFTHKTASYRYGDHAGQEQLWFLVELCAKEAVDIDVAKEEFSKLEWVSLSEFLKRYAIWKQAVVYDFCRECKCDLSKERFSRDA